MEPDGYPSIPKGLDGVTNIDNLSNPKGLINYHLCSNFNHLTVTVTLRFKMGVPF
jgi:hypothetical protein